MADIVDRPTRSRMMSGIKGKDTHPELLVRKALFAKGFRYRLHSKNLPGKPDLVFPKYNAVVFIHGCFWHGHDCHLFKWPKTRKVFWQEKLTGNMERDRRNMENLFSNGWRILTIWECSLKGKGKLDFNKLVNDTIQWLKTGKSNQLIAGIQ